jgi:hypothetical protein
MNYVIQPRTSRTWDKEFKMSLKHGDNYSSMALKAIKSCIEADEPYALEEIVRNDKHAKIYALMSCFTMIPAVKCIEYLISAGTPLDVRFTNNPYGNFTAQEYLDAKFGTSDNFTMRIRVKIEVAINKGRMNVRKYSCEEYTAIFIN